MAAIKATQANFRSHAGKAAKTCHTFFFCGQDEAAASEAAATIVEQWDDPGERVDMSGADLRRDPVLLADEARSSSLFGDRRHILVRAAGDEAHDALANHLEAEGEACPVLVIATSATDKSRTAKLLAKQDGTMVAVFWPPDLKAVAESVRNLGDAAGLRIGTDIAERIARGANLDIRLCRSEVNKLSLFLDADTTAPKTADAAALDAIGASTEEDGFAPLVNVVLGGETRNLAREMARMREVSMNPVGLLLALERRAAQLAGIAARIGPGDRLTDVVEAEQRARRIFWRDRRDIEHQLGRWRGVRLERLVERLARTHRKLLENSGSAETILAQELAAITRFAAPKNRTR